MKTARHMLAVVVLMAAVGLAMGAPISFDFYGHSTSGGVQSGEPDVNVDGLQLPGQVGNWGTLPAANTSATQRQGTVGAHTFTFNVGGAEMISAWTAGGTDALRRDYYYINNPARYSGPVPWRIEGLTPGANHDLILFGTGSSGPAQVYIPGYDAGNGVGAAVTLDSEGDANFTSVVADGSGQINGFYDTPASTSASIAGVQFEEVAGGGGGGGGALGGELGILDLTANGGINPATGNPWAAGDQYRLAFLSGTPTNAVSTDINTYNAFLDGLGDAALGGGDWKVLGSTSTVDARDNTSTNPGVDGTGEAIFLVDGVTKIADNYGDLWDGSLDNPLTLNEDGVTYGSGDVFTGTNGDGTKRGRPLGGSDPPDYKVTIGRSHVAGQWMVIYNTSPTNSLPIYAISDPLTVREVGVAGDIPEPATMALVGLAVCGLGGYVRKRKRA